MRLRGATPPHGLFLLVLEPPRDLTEPIRASRRPDHPPTTTVASTLLRIGARASRSSALRPVKRWPDSRLRGRRLPGPLRCPRASRVRALRSRGRCGSGGCRLSIRVQRHRRRRNRRLHGIGRPRAHPTGRKPLNAQLQSAVRVRVGPTNQPHLRGRPRAFRRSSASRVSLNPPRSHSVAPNPGLQRTRFARR